MTVLAKIESINSDNTCTVHIPVFDTAGINSPTRMPATIATPPGVYNNYAVGDVVYVTFENNTIEDALILGKLYTGAQKEGERTNGAVVTSSLKVLNDAALPNTTTIGGISWQDLVNYGNRLTQIECNPAIIKAGSIEKELVYSCLPKSIVNGTLVNPITISGGDGAASNKLILDQAKLGQITDSGTSTLLGFINSSTLTVGHTGYVLNFRGKNQRPIYNSSELAFLSDIGSKDKLVFTDTDQEITGCKIFTNKYPDTIINPGIYLGFVEGIDRYTSKPYKTGTLSLISAGDTTFTPFGATLKLGTTAEPEQFVILSAESRDTTYINFKNRGNSIYLKNESGILALLEDIPNEKFNWLNPKQALTNRYWIDNKQLYVGTFRISNASQAYIKTAVAFPIIAGTIFDIVLDLAKAIGTQYNRAWIDLAHTIQIGTNYIFNPYTIPNQADYLMVYIDKTNNELHIKGKALENITEFNIVINYTKD